MVQFSSYDLNAFDEDPFDNLELPQAPSGFHTDLKETYNAVVRKGADWTVLVSRLEDDSQKNVMQLYLDQKLSFAEIATRNNTCHTTSRDLAIKSLQTLQRHWGRSERSICKESKSLQNSQTLPSAKISPYEHT